ncbi:MAG TPA: hypothetical protein VFQ82_01290 [Stellaceae bacterium]|jgi:hypothetical protein|nr:hypothetical protein [Stellaceae bacterium]
MTRRHGLAIAAVLAVALSGFGAWAAGPATEIAVRNSGVPAGTARVWFLRQTDAFGAIQSAAPMIFADGSPIGRSLPGTVFYRDFAPGAYTFTVEPYGQALPTGQALQATLAPGSETYLQVQWVASWQFGYPSANWSDYPNTFGIVGMPPQLAQAYMRTMTNLGQR